VAGRLEGKVALITGTGGGQGRAAALAFASEGATIVGCDVKVDGAAETVELVRAAGGAMTSTAPVDLGDAAQARAWIDAAAGEHGGFDVLYNNAAVVRFFPIGEGHDEDWHFTIRNELDLVYYACDAAWKHLVARGGGAIINTASISGLSATGALAPGGFAHAATKGAVLALTRELAVEGAPHGIRANSVSPGIIRSPATEEMLAAPGVAERFNDSLLIKRLGSPSDIAPAAVFLASDEASWVTGTNIVVDGGFTAW
jgi:NAD(P)-dependent dehydrogenase (short-subunit alcohol dehydrogenase family)